MSRGLAFWNDETIDLIRESFVAVAVPTWVAREEGPEGAFLRGAGIDEIWVTSSGYMTCMSASGRLLGRQPSEDVLAAFKSLPPEERRPGAVRVADLEPAETVIPEPPRDGLVLRVHARFLTEDDERGLRHARVDDFPLMRDNPEIMRTWRLFLEPNTEYMWLTADEWQALVPDEPVEGRVLGVPTAIAMRMARFHLNPKRATTSEGDIVDRRKVKTADLRLAVEEVTSELVNMRMTGSVHWGSAFDDSKATSPDGPLTLGYSAPIEGRLRFDRENESFTRFDVVVLGHVWGRWGDANNASMYVERPGKTPFGFAFELAKGDTPTDRIPPGGNGRYVTERTGYFGGGD